MGKAYSKYKAEKEEKARSKRELIQQLEDLGEYIELIKQERQRLENRLNPNPPELKPKTPGRICLTDRIIDIYKGREALVRDISVKEKILYLSKQKYDSMEEYLSRLRKDRDELERENSKEKPKLAASKERLKAYQALRLKKGNPKDTWTVCSLPNLHFKKVVTSTKRRKA